MCTSKDKPIKHTKKKLKQVPSRPGYRISDYIHPKSVNSPALPMDIIPNGKWFVSTYLFNLVELVKIFPLIYWFLQQRWTSVDIPCNKGSHTKFEQSTESTGIFENCYCILQYGMRSNESTNRLMASTCNKSAPCSSSGCTFWGVS